MNKPKKQPSVELYSGIRVDSPETLAEVLRLLDSLDDLKPMTPALRQLGGITRFRVREAMAKPKIETPRGRRFVG